MDIYKNKNFRTIKIKIKVKATNHKGIHKSLFELPDRRVEIKKMPQSLPLVCDWDNFFLRQENLWLSSKFTLQKYIVHIFISS